MKIRRKIYSDFKLVERDKPIARASNNLLLSTKNQLRMFRNKRNFSILISPSTKAPHVSTLAQPTPSKRIRLASFRNSTLLNDNQTTPSLPESSPVLQRRDELPAFLGEKVSKIFLAQNEPISISNGFFDHGNRSASPAVTPTTTVEQTDEPRIEIYANELLKSKETPPPTPNDRRESMVEILSREKADLEMEARKLDAEIDVIFQAISNNKENCIKFQQMSYALEDKVDVSLKSFYQVRNLLNDIYNPGLEVTKSCTLILEETKRRHSIKLDKLLLCLNDRIETSEKAISSKEKELEHSIELHQRTLIALETQEQEEKAKLAEQAELKVAMEQQVQEVQHNDEPALDPIQQLSQNPTSVVVMETTEDDCVIIDCEHNKTNESATEATTFAETPEIQDIEVNNQHWIPNQSENNATCEDEEETDIEESKEDEDEGSFTPQQAQRV